VKKHRVGLDIVHEELIKSLALPSHQ